MAQRVSKDLRIKDAIKDDDNSSVLYGKHQQKNVNKLLAMTMEDANGNESSVFKVVEANGLQRYRCRLCTTDNMDFAKFISHAGSRNHVLRLRTIQEKHSLSKKQRIDSTVEVPSELQQRLTEITDQVMIGMDYIIEMSIGDTFEPHFHCVLCDGKFDLQVIIHHLTSYVHRLKYLEKHFPTAFKKISRMEKREQKYNFLETVCQRIEHRYGRMSIKAVQSDQFAASQTMLFDSILKAKHIDEKMGRTFCEAENINQSRGLSPVSEIDETNSTSGRDSETNSTCSLESISTASEFEMSPYALKEKRRNQKSDLSPITPERTNEFDKKFRSTYDTGPARAPPFHTSKRHFNKTTDESRAQRKQYDLQNSSSSSNYGRDKYSTGFGEKSPKRNSAGRRDNKSHAGVHRKRDRSRSPHHRLREKNHKSRAGISSNRNRSRSPQGHQFLMQSSHQSSADYGKIRVRDNFDLHPKSTLPSERSESAIFGPSYETQSTSERCSHPTSKKLHQYYGPFSASIDREEIALSRCSPGTTNRGDYLSMYNSYDYNHGEGRIRDGEYMSSRPQLYRTSRSEYSFNYDRSAENIPDSIDHGEYIPSRPHQKMPLGCSGRVNNSQETVVSAESYAYCNREPQTSMYPDDMDDGEPVTIISVLSLLSALENLLGSLGPKMTELMIEAVAMENICVNFSNRILDDLGHCILFETTKEKLKGLLSADLVEPNKIPGIKRTVRHMDMLIDEANARKRVMATSSQNFNATVTSMSSSQLKNHDRHAVAEKILVAMNEQGRANISKVELAQYVDKYISLVNAKECDDDDERGGRSAMEKTADKCDHVSNYVDSIFANTQTNHIGEAMESTRNSLIPVNPIIITPTQQTNCNETVDASADSPILSDSNLITLVKNFSILSDSEKRDLISNIRQIQFHDPERMQRLRNEMEIEKLLYFASTEMPDDKTLVLKTLKSEPEQN